MLGSTIPPTAERRGNAATSMVLPLVRDFLVRDFLVRDFLVRDFLDLKIFLINLQPSATNSGLKAAQKNKVLAQRDAEVFSCAETAAEGKGMDVAQAL
jgi:hypothetical protein